MPSSAPTPSLVAPVTVGRGATLGAGTTLTKDAPPDTLTVSRARQPESALRQRPRENFEEVNLNHVWHRRRGRRPQHRPRPAGRPAQARIPRLRLRRPRRPHGGLHRLRAVGRVAELPPRRMRHPHHRQHRHRPHRWATHGVPSESNAHPTSPAVSPSSTTASSRTTKPCARQP